MPSNPQILSDLLAVKEAGHRLELVNTYKGVPFICPAEILFIDSEQAVLQASHPSLVCLLEKPQTRVLASDYFEPMVAQVTSVDLPAGRLTLTGFIYAGAHVGDRTIVRVEPREPLRVDLSWHYKLTGESGSAVMEMADLSLNGIGLRYTVEVTPAGLKPGAEVTAAFPLPGAVQMISNGAILTVTRREDQVRLAMRFNPDNPHKAAIFRYMADRRVEIEKELREAYTAALQQA